MKIINHIYNLIYNKVVLSFSIVLILFIVFKTPVEIFISNTMVRHLFSKIPSLWYIDTLFFAVVFSVIIFIWQKFKRYTPSRNLTIILVLYSLVYVAYRTTSNIWVFTSLKLFPFLYYADIILVLTLSQLLLLIKKKRKESTNENNSFFDDHPVESKKKDKLGYGHYADQLSSKILSSQFKNSFAIGVNGRWGFGKSSFINLIKQNLEKEDIIEIDFNPWNSYTPQAIIRDFFDTVQESVRPHHSSLSRLITQYSNKLEDLNSNTVTQSIQTIVAALTGSGSINSLHEEINDTLISINKKIVVYIDDLDRLDKNEILEVIRLIRNTANFHNTFFIVAYDRNYVVNALNQHNSYKNEEFLEKIFQIEITLPYFKKDVLRHELAKKLKETFSEKWYETIDDCIIGSSTSIPSYLNDWLESLRDVTRLVNAIALNFDNLKGEVDFADFMRMEILRLKYPSVYELIFRNTSNFFETKQSNSSFLYHYSLKKINDGVRLKKKIDGRFQNYFELYLDDNYLELSIQKKDVEKISNFIDEIFGDRYSYSHMYRSHLSVIYPSKFNRYFAYSLLDDNLSEIEFSKARTLSKTEFNKKITEWVNRNLESEVKSRFEEIKDFDNQEDFEKIITAIFHLANIPIKKDYSENYSLLGYGGRDLMNKMNNYDDKITKLYKLNNNELKDLVSFTKELFYGANTPYLFESDFLRFVNEHYSESFPIDKEELANISFKYLKDYCESISKIDSNVWRLLWNCEQTKWIPDYNGSNASSRHQSFPEEVKKFMIEFFLNKHLNQFLLAIIDREPFDHKGFKIKYEIILMLFDNWQNFENLLNELEQNDYLKEFLLFLRNFAEKNYSHYIEFEFKVIPTKSKWVD